VVFDPYYFRIAVDYIHLNPARVGLAGESHGRLSDCAGSSLQHHARGNGPDWLESDRVLRASELAEETRGRQADLAWLEERAANDGVRPRRGRPVNRIGIVSPKNPSPMTAYAPQRFAPNSPKC